MNGLTGNTSVRRLSRETRHLLLAACLALLALWVLARIRFPERPPTPNPISPLLTQLSARPGFTVLEADIAALQTRLSPSLLRVPADSEVAGDALASAATEPQPALRISTDTAITLLDPAVTDLPAEVLALDGGTGLALVRAPALDRAALPVPWAADTLAAPRYLLAASAAAQGVWLRPVFVGGFTPQPHPGWSGPVWTVATTADLEAGTLLFTADGDFVGGVVRDRAGVFVVPGHVLITDAQQLRARRGLPRGTLPIEVHSLTAALRRATGATSGVIVAWIDPGASPAPGLATGDVIVAVNGRPLASGRDWQVHAGRVAPGEGVTLTVRRGETTREVVVTAVSHEAPEGTPLGLVLRSMPRVGSEVIRVEGGSAAARAGLQPGDLIIAAGAVRAPGPAQVAQIYAAADAERPVLLGVARGERHRVVALVKK